MSQYPLKNKVIAVSLAALTLCLAPSAWGADVRALENDFTKVAETVGPAVVTVAMERTGKVKIFGPDQIFRNYFGQLPEREVKQQGLGSGVIFDKRGYILTNQHVIEGASSIAVILPDGRAFPAKLLGEDRRRDIAVLKIEGENIPVAELGSSDKLKPGQWAIAIGNPFGHIVKSPQPTVTVGVISALHRSLPVANQASDRIYVNLIQTDAAINIGNSGGPLCDLNGKVIGINVAMLGQSGGNVDIGFAIPIDTVKSVLDDLISGKKIAYGWIGIGAQDITPEMAKYFGLDSTTGALVAAIDNNGPGAKAGLKAGDVVLKFNGEAVNGSQSLIDKINNSKVGGAATLDIMRDKKPSVIRVIVGLRPDNRPIAPETEKAPLGRESKAEWRGMRVSSVTDELAKKLNISDRRGVVITDMASEGAAYAAGLRPGDVIREINRRGIIGVNDFAVVARAVKGNALVRTDKGYYIVGEGN
jgi:serine protease Do